MIDLLIQFFRDVGLAMIVIGVAALMFLAAMGGGKR